MPEDKPQPAAKPAVSKSPTRLSSNRRRFVVTARGGDPDKVTREQYEKEYSAYEDEVLARYPAQDLAELRKRTGNEALDPAVAQGFLPSKAEEASGVTGTSKSGEIEGSEGGSGQTRSSGAAPSRE